MAQIRLSNGNMAEAMVSIGAYAVPDPSEYSGLTSTIVDGARNSQGEFIGGIIREDIAKVDMSWRFISTQNWATLLAKFTTSMGGNFVNAITLFNQSTGAWETRNMYVSDRKANVFKRDDAGNIIGYTNASLSLVEV